MKHMTKAFRRRSVPLVQGMIVICELEHAICYLDTGKFPIIEWLVEYRLVEH